MSYNIAGMAIKNEYLALGTILTTIAVGATQLGGSKDAGSKAPAPIAQDTSIAASSSAEEDFIRQFVAEAEKEEKKGH
ncbi:hypothetical protein JCM24511_02248 [Saitozyma sp. JCM 24511]|nr:hypothetical protein JCM24511_02248 [Saitozyma sp. JCM 24511]